MSSPEIVDKLRTMAESPVYAMRRGVLLIAAENLEVIGAENLALERAEQQLQAELDKAKLLNEFYIEGLDKNTSQIEQLQKALALARSMICGGESFTTISRKIVEDALKEK